MLQMRLRIFLKLDPLREVVQGHLLRVAHLLSCGDLHRLDCAPVEAVQRAEPIAGEPRRAVNAVKVVLRQSGERGEAQAVNLRSLRVCLPDEPRKDIVLVRLDLLRDNASYRDILVRVARLQELRLAA